MHASTPSPKPGRTVRATLVCALVGAVICGGPELGAGQGGRGTAFGAPDGAAQESAAWRKAREQVIAKLLQHAKVCRAKKCIRESRAAFEAVIALDEENAEARKALSHEKKGGRWYIPGASKLPDSPPKLVDEIEAARKAIVEPFVARALELAAAAGTPADLRETVAADAVAADPSNPDARKANREVDDKGVWRLAETVAANARRAELSAAFRKVFDATKAPALEAADDDESEALGAGAQAARSQFGRVAGSATNDETADVVRLQPGLERLYEQAIAAPRPLRGLKVRLFPDTASGVAAIQKDARFDANARSLGERLGAVWVPGKLEYLIYGETPEGRREMALRAAVGTWLFWGYQIDAKRGWALEGVDHWFSEMALGTHRITYFRPSEYAGETAVAALSDEMKADDANWIEIASHLAMSDAWGGVRSIQAKDVNSLGPEGLLLAYVLSRYVIEAYPQVAPDVLTAVASGEQTDLWMGRLLGSTPEGLDRRLKRWTAELVATAPKAAPAPPPEKPPEKAPEPPK